MDLNGWAAIGSVVSAGVAFGGIIGAVVGAILSRTKVDLWIDSGTSGWRYAGRKDPREQRDPTVRFRVSNVGDATALRVDVESEQGEVKEVIDVGTTISGRPIPLRTIPILESGATRWFSLSVPIDTWDMAGVTLRWTRVPAGRPLARKRKHVRLSKVLPAPVLNYSPFSKPKLDYEASSVADMEAQLLADGLEDEVRGDRPPAARN